MPRIAHTLATSRVCHIVMVGVLLFAALVTATPVSGPDVITASTPPGGAPPAGSGTVRSSAMLRVLDGNTLITWINGKQVAVRLAGIDVAPYTTPCGAAATSQLWKLTRGGELTLEEDTTLAFDSHGLRIYHALDRNGHAISQELVKAGVAKVNGKAEARHLFAADEAQARTAQRGCLWSTSSPTAGVVDTARIETAMEMHDTFRAAPAASQRDTPVRASTVLPNGFSFQTVATGIDQPTGFAFAPDGRIFIIAKHGLVWVVKNGALLPTPLIDISATVNDYDDHGLLGIAVDPHFSTTSPYLYLLYTYENDPANPTNNKTARLSRYTVAGDVADPASQQAILGTVVGDAARPSCDNFPVGTDCLVSDNISHSIGSVRFASDGTLFVSIGDASNFNIADPESLRSQNIDILAGKLLHVTTTGQGLTSNLFYDGNVSDNRSKVWAYGLRNPFRFTLRPGTDMPYVGDVGWDTWEEINVATKSGNFGWPCYEGTYQQSAFAPMQTCKDLYSKGAGAVKFGLVTYDHLGGVLPVSTAVIGGAFYTGANYPAQYRGTYFYGDVRPFMRTLQVDSNDALVSGPTDFSPNADLPTDIEMGPDGNLYVCAIYAGEIRKIVYDANAPTVQVAADHQSGPAPLTVQFSSAGSNDPRGGTLSYSWDFGDGSALSTDANPTHTFTLQCGVSACRYITTLTVTSSSTHASGTGGMTIGVGGAPTPTMSAPSASLAYRVGDTITFSGGATDDLDGPIPPSGLSWQIVIHHCPGTCHTHFLIQRSGVANGSFTIPDHGDNSYFEIILTATNSSAVTATTSVSLHPQTVHVTLQTSPPGRQLVYDGGVTYTAPHTFNSVIGSQHTITAPTSPGGPPFVSWSDGGAAQHNITIGTSDVTYTATYDLPAPMPGSRSPASIPSTPPAPLPESRPPASVSQTPPAPLPPSR
ncbi:MAG: PQQ-dependent sugar dehydrogenase [Chloroflexota bacterium]|nr:PQQ-dependent sugar dehydrogenase [Chloroflexota bacterium]